MILLTMEQLFLEKIIQVEVRNESEEIFNSLKNKKVGGYLINDCK